MPRLPTANDLGRVSLRPATGVASPDLSAPYRAAQQLGNQVTQIAGEVADDQNRLAYGQAQTAWLQGQADTHAAFEKDNDYATMQDRYGQQMQKVTESSASGITSSRMRQEFDNWVNQQNIRGGEQIRSLAWNKEKDASIAGLNQSLETSRSTYLTSADPATRQQILDATNNMIQGAASKGYIDQTQAQQLGQRWITDAATGSLKMMQPEQRLSALRNPQGITTFLPPDQRQEMMKDAAFEGTALKLADLKQPNADGSVNLDTFNVTGDALTNAIFQQESGNRHRNADGSLVTSPKGAQGAGQIMPPTGKEPGFGVKPLQDNSEQENRRFTGDYIGAMLKRYDGNQILALAAYNAGPGKVDDWIKRIGDPRSGQVTNQQFASSIPVSETRNYVYRVADKATKGASYQAITDSPEFKMMSPQQQLQVASTIASMRNQDNALELRREKEAASAANSMQVRIANGQIPSSNDWNTYSQAVSGTAYDGSAEVLQGLTAKTQQLYSLPIAIAQNEVDRMTLELRENGGDATQYRVLDAVQSNLNQRRSDLQSNPQRVFALDSGQSLPPANVSDALQQPGAWGQVLAQRQVNSDAIAQKYGPTAGKNLLTTDELHNTQDAYEKMSPDQRIQFWRNTQASSTPAIASRLAREIGGDALQVSAVAGLARNPAGYKTALAVENGSRLLNPVDGAPKVRLPASFDQDVGDAIKKQYPTLSPAQVQRLIPVVRDYHIGTGGAPDTTPKAEALHEVIGKPVNIYGSYAIAPAGTDENTFIDALKIGVNRLGDSAQDVKNGLNQGVYGFVTDSDGNQVLINAATQRRVVGKDGRPVVIEVGK